MTLIVGAMPSGPSERALEVARAEADELVGRGAEAVFLTGSHARGDAHPESDLDVRAVGEGSYPPLKRHDEFLISTSWTTKEDNEKAFEDPSAVGQSVPGWRSAVILHDPNEIAAGFKERAEKWSWDEISDAADEWVAEQVTDYAEEIHTLIGNLDQEQISGAAAIRSQLALHLAEFLSVHHRILYESENELWDEVAEAMGPDYEARQRVALGIEGSSLEESARAAMDLFGIAAAQTAHLLDDTQRAVVAHACELAGRPLPG
jgi:hypothetical protein